MRPAIHGCDVSLRVTLTGMSLGRLISIATIAALSVIAANRWARYEHEMQNPADDPPDAWEKTEFAFARLRYRSDRGGWRGARWGVDANTSERHFMQGLRRL